MFENNVKKKLVPPQREVRALIYSGFFSISLNFEISNPSMITAKATIKKSATYCILFSPFFGFPNW